MGFRLGPARVDHDAAQGLAAGDVEKTLAQAPVKRQVHALVAVLARRPVRGARSPDFRRQVEDQGQIGREITDGQPVKGFDRGTFETLAVALVGQGRIGEAVGDHPATGLKGGPHRPHQVVAPRREVQQGLGERIPAADVAVDQQLADLLGAGRAAGLARGEQVDSGAGKRLGIELMTTAGNRSRELVQQVLQSQWRDIGVATRIRNEPARVYFGETVTKRKFTALAMFAWLSAPENVPRSTLHSKEIPTAANNYSGQNYTGYANAEVDELLEAIEVELDRDKRRALWHRLQRIYASELPVIPLFFRADAYIMPKWLKGIEPTGHQYPTSTWVENWRAER